MEEPKLNNFCLYCTYSYIRLTDERGGNGPLETGISLPLYNINCTVHNNNRKCNKKRGVTRGILKKGDHTSNLTERGILKNGTSLIEIKNITSE